MGTPTKLLLANSLVTVILFLFSAELAHSQHVNLSDYWISEYDFPGANYQVLDIEVDGDDIYYGGYFNYFNGHKSSNLIKWNKNKANWEDIGLEGTRAPIAFTVENGTIYTDQGEIKKWDGVKWETLLDKYMGYVYDFFPTDSGLFIGGHILWINDEPTASGLAFWDGTEWSSPTHNSPYDRKKVYDIEFIDKLYVCGEFSEFAGVACNNIVAWDGQKWEAVGDGVNGNAHKMFVYENKLIVGGEFTEAGGTEAKYLAQWDGTNWTPFGGELDCPVTEIELHQNKLTVAQNQETNLRNGFLGEFKISQWDGSKWITLVDNFDSKILAIKSFESELHIGGEFSKVGSYKANNIVVFDGNNFENYPGQFNNGPNGHIYDILTVGDSAFIVGDFTHLGNIEVNNIALWDGNNWNSVGSGTNASISSIIQYKDQFVIGGNFDRVGGQKAGPIALWDGQKWSVMDTTFFDRGSSIHDLAIFKDTIYACGMLPSNPQVEIKGVIKWDGSKWSSTSTGLSNNWIPLFTELEVYNDELYAIANAAISENGENLTFTKYDGSSWENLTQPSISLWGLYASKTGLYTNLFTSATSYVGRWNGSDWEKLSGLEDAGNGSCIQSFTSDEDNLYVSGGFYLNSETELSYFAKWDGANWSRPISDLNISCTSMEKKRA